MDRFRVTYRITSKDRYDAEARAAAIALENTLEIPREQAAVGYISDVILGRVENVSPLDEGVWLGEISYHVDAVGCEFAQLLNVVFGNASLLAGVKVVGITPNAELVRRFPGARFGADGVRRVSGLQEGGYVCSVIKPQGSCVGELARLSYDCAVAGANIIKEDHGLANQDAAPFRERVQANAMAVSRANETRPASDMGAGAMYFANITGHASDMRDLAFYAKEVGAHGVLMTPGLSGFGAMSDLASDKDFDLPIMAHPSHLGPYVLSPNTGYSHGALFGDLMRLAGADISVFPNFGGRFGFSKQECRQIVSRCRSDQAIGKPILPSPGGGMALETLPEMFREFGEDCVYLLGGSLLGLKDRLASGISQARISVGQTPHIAP